MTYMLSESAARKLRELLRDPSALVPSQIGQTRRVRSDSSGGGASFHLAVSMVRVGGENVKASYSVKVAKGVVQVGGYTYEFDGGEIAAPAGDAIVCIRVGLATGGIEVVTFPDLKGLNAAQKNMEYYIFPLAKISGNRKVMDYRPLPQAGCWETYTTKQES